MSEHNVGATPAKFGGDAQRISSARLSRHSERRQYQTESDDSFRKRRGSAPRITEANRTWRTLLNAKRTDRKILEKQPSWSLAGIIQGSCETVTLTNCLGHRTGKTLPPRSAERTLSFGVVERIYDEATARRVRIQYGQRQTANAVN